MRRTITIGSRASRLARKMAEDVLNPLRQAFPDLNFKHQAVSTEGDRDRATSLRDMGGEYGGVFAKELENALLAKEIDLAVHSLKDLPTRLPVGLTLGAVPAREEVRDALCGSRLAELRDGARVGTGSPRRHAQLLRVRPDLVLVPLRGNVPGRLARLRGASPLNAVVLAAAGLRRLGLEADITELLPLEDFPHAVGQAAVGLEIREDDELLHSILQSIHDENTARCVWAERALLRTLRGGCSVPIGVYSDIAEGTLTLHAQITSLDGRRTISKSLSGPAAAAEKVGTELAKLMVDAGATQLLEEAREAPKS